MKINFAGIVDGQEEYEAVVKSMRSGWHGPGPQADAFEKEFSNYLGVEHVLMTNSGSSANLLALKSLHLSEDALVITSGCGFPATLNPILHLGYRPVLLDYDIKTQNINLNQVEETLRNGSQNFGRYPRIEAMIVAHTMGNPIDMELLMILADKYNVKVIEDCCEALGSVFQGVSVGNWGHVGTFSFYPSHQMNGLGSGGCLVTNDLDIALEARSLRNWGKLVRVPEFAGDHVTEYTNEIDGIKYDDQYTYQTVGFNMQPNDIQCAYLREQLKRLPGFKKRREENWIYLKDNISIPGISTMEVHEDADPSYFGFTMVLSDKMEGKRDEFANYLESNGIRTRPFFAGNITRHEPYRDFYQEFPVADYLMKNALFLGVWPGLNFFHMEEIVRVVNGFK